MVAINSIPQQEVANGNGQSENLRAIPIISLNFPAKKPSPSIPGGAGALVLITGLLSYIFNFFKVFLKNLTLMCKIL